MTNLENRVAVVTGAGAGIGRATALRLARAGAAVVVNDIDAAAADHTVAAVRDAGGRADACPGDVTQPGAADALVARAVECFGSLSIFHANAGGARPEPMDGMTDAAYREIMALNFDAVWSGTQAALRVMLPAGGGAIVVTSSGAAVSAEPGLAAYGAAKAAVISLVRNLAVEYAGRGIRANAVVPGPIETVQMRAWLDSLPDRGAGFGARVPAGRLGRPEEIAEAVLFLASDAASFVNGVALPVDGGVVARLASPTAG
ncbi:MAG: glucose 1-dehydrogenase [Myxococcota bacterium]|nr:glucose 1-dehydrogenase [Myxococcota bacterium]